MTSTSTPAVAGAFAAGFHGTLTTASDNTYDAARRVWNDMIDARPALIAGCRTVDDIVDAVSLGAASGLPLAVRGGGHSVAGLSTCEGGVVIDLSAMRDVAINPDARIAHVQPGATWADLDAASSEHGLATTGGLISTTGVAGLTLGGGIGWLQRRYGLACDNLVSADLVTADGRPVHASETENPSLLWGLRGGGGNFGVVTDFTFTLHAVDTILGGLLMFPIERGRDVLRAFRAWAAGAPDEATMLVAISVAPPEPFVPADLVGRPVVLLVGCWCGGLDQGSVVLAPLRELGPVADAFGPMPYRVLNSMLDGGAAPGLRNYFRGGYLADLTDDVIDVVLDHGARMPSPMSQIHLHQMGGAVARVGPEASAFNGRAAGYTYNLVSTWSEPVDDEPNIRANRELATAMDALSMAGGYVNFETGRDAVRALYGDGIYDRLARLKREYDPANLFRTNQNVAPAR